MPVIRVSVIHATMEFNYPNFDLDKFWYLNYP